jgi:hypothetical protein
MISKIKKLVKNALLLLPVMFLSVNGADCSGNPYYSIHLFSFKNLEDANKHVNALRNKGKMVFWESVKIQGVGRYYRVYMGRYKSWDEAMQFRNKIKETDTGSPLGIQCFFETFVSDKKQTPPKSIALKKSAMVPTLSPISEKDRFVDNGDGTLLDRTTNLMWIKNGWRLDFLSAVTWWDAVKQSKDLKVGSYDDWRLPTIEEWSSLIDTANQNPALVDPSPFVNIISHMPYWSQTEFTYGKDHTCNHQCPFESYTVMLYSGRIQHQKKSGRAFIMPVRSLDLPDNLMSNTAR